MSVRSNRPQARKRVCEMQMRRKLERLQRSVSERNEYIAVLMAPMTEPQAQGIDPDYNRMERVAQYAAPRWWPISR